MIEANEAGEARTACLADPRIRRIHDYWAARCRDGNLPARGDLEPADLPDLLSYLLLVDVMRAPLRLRYRLVGTWICSWVGRDPTGQDLEEGHMTGDWSRVQADYRRTVEAGVPTFAVARPIDRGRDFLPINRVFLPLAADGINVDMVLVCVSPVEG